MIRLPSHLISLVILVLLLGGGARTVQAESSALLIGVENYGQPKIPPFTGAMADCGQLAAALGESGVFTALNIETLPAVTSPAEAGSQKVGGPTRQEILGRLDALAQRTGTNDTVLLYFAGHCVFNGEATYLLTTDSDLTNQKTLRETGVSAADLNAALGKLAVKHLILLFDINRAVTISGITPAAVPPATRHSLTTRQIRDLAIDPPLTNDSMALFACSAQENGVGAIAVKNVPAGKAVPSPFAAAIINGVRGAACDERGEVLAGDLASYVRKAVFANLTGMQSPFLVVAEGEAASTVLARGKTLGTGGATALSAGTLLSKAGQTAEALQRGYELFLDKRYVGARSKFSAALRLDPSIDHAEFMLGLVDNVGYRDAMSAESHWRRSITLNPTRARPALELAALLFEKKNDVAGAEALYRQFSANTDVAALNGLARLQHRGKKDLAGAEKTYRLALERDANNVAALSGLAEVLFDLSRFDAALHVLDFAATIEPERADLALQQAACMVKLERKDDAKKVAQRALTLGYRGDSGLFKELGLPAAPAAFEVRPESVFDVPGLLKEGEILLSRGYYRLAQLKFEQVLESQPASAPAITMLGVVAQQYSRDSQEAERLYRQAMEIDATAAEPRFRLGSLLVLARDYPNAEPLFVKAMELAPKDSRPVTSLGEIFYQRFDYKRAEELFRKAMELDPLSPMPVNNMGILSLDGKSDIKQAEKFFRKAMELDPNSALPISNLATLQMNRIGDYAEAEKLLRKAIELEPYEGFYYANLAFCVLQQKRRPEAEAIATRARDIGFKGEHPVYALLQAKPK